MRLGEGLLLPLKTGRLYGYDRRSPTLLQPTIICSPVDQAGSLLLFRGYGVSKQARPIQAALVAQDSVLIVDKEHFFRFRSTLVTKLRLVMPMLLKLRFNHFLIACAAVIRFLMWSSAIH